MHPERADEVFMVPTCEVIQELADRVERAFRRNRPHWRLGTSNPGVWSCAASLLMRLHELDPSIPVDPELYVASQPVASPLDDPWQVLAQEESARRYAKHIRRIVRSLRRELRGEIRRAEARLLRGIPIDVILRAGPDRLSPLGRIIVAHRADRPDLAEDWLEATADQHRSCPLYRQACRGLLAADDYPGEDTPLEFDVVRPFAVDSRHFSMN